MAKHTTRAEHPISTVITHWIHIVALLVLVFTGFWIHDPFTSWSFHTVRYVHLFAAFFLVGTGVFRVYWGFFGTGSADVGSTKKVKDWHFFFPQKENKGTFWEVVKYYLFLRKTHPCTAKYNPLQKLAYGALLFAIIIDAFTGLAMWHVTQPYFQPLTYWIGGTQMIRQWHYLAMWLFIVITAAHRRHRGAVGGAADVLLEGGPSRAHRVCRRAPAAEGEQETAGAGSGEPRRDEGRLIWARQETPRVKTAAGRRPAAVSRSSA